MSKSTSTKTFAKGEVIFKEGSRGRCAYLVDHGRVEIVINSDKGPTRVGILGLGEIFGEMAVINGAVRSATAVALDDCELIEIPRDQLKERIEDSDDIVKYLLKVLINRLRESIKIADESSLMDDKTTSTLINLEDFKKSQKVVEKIKLERSLNDAVENDELSVHYQPILNFKTGDVAGFEALMRWNSPTMGFMRPDVFMGVAEETSLIIPMGQWIIKKVCYDFARLKKKMRAKKRFNDDMFVGINIAVKQFNDPKLFDVLNYSVEKYGLKPKHIKLEITERVLIAGDYVFEWIQKARDYGYSVALDDFGTGYSSLSYLANLNVNNLKVDKSFVEKMVEDKKTHSIVNSIVGLAKDLDMTVIAEGVETKAEWNALKKLGCTYMQGYLYSKPLPLTDIIVMMTDEQIKKVA